MGTRGDAHVLYTGEGGAKVPGTEFSTGDDSVPCSPRGHLAPSRNIFGVTTGGGACHWHLVTGVLLNTPPRTGLPTAKTHPASHAHSAQAERPCSAVPPTGSLEEDPAGPTEGVPFVSTAPFQGRVLHTHSHLRKEAKRRAHKTPSSTVGVGKRQKQPK